MTQNLINASFVPFGVPVVDPSGQALTSLSPEDGELLIGAAGNPIIGALISAGANVTLTPGAGTLTIEASGGGGTISSVVVTRRTFSTTHVFNADMIAAEIVASGTGGMAPTWNSQLTGSDPMYPINYVSAPGGGDGGSFVIVFGSRDQLGSQVVWTRGAISGSVTGIDPYLVAVLSPPPDQPAYSGWEGGTSSLAFQAGPVVTIPGGAASRTVMGLVSTDTAALPFISPDGMVASKRSASPVLPTSTDPSILKVAGTGGPGFPGIGAGTGTGANDLRVLSPGIGGGTGFGTQGPASQGTIEGTPTSTNLGSEGQGGSGLCTGDLTRTAALAGAASDAGYALIIEYIS